MAFLQLRSSRQGASSGERAAELLLARARSMGSRTLSKFAATIAAQPFEKVIGLIEGLIAKLNREAAEEADHKKWCDEQLHANKLKRNKKSAQAEKLAADVEGLAADIADKKANIGELVEEQSALAKARQEATSLGEQEKAENSATIAEAAAGSEAV